MPIFVMLTRLSPAALASPKSLEELEREAMARIRTECSEVKWIHNYGVLGPCDYLDIFEAPDIDTAFKVATLVRTFGHAHTEVWAAIEWTRFKDMIRDLPGGQKR